MPWKVRSRLIRFWEPTFTVSAAAIIVNDEGCVLLLDHYLRANSGWGMPGGFLGHNEQPDKGIRREIREETELELEELKMYRVRTLGRHVEILFTARANGTPKLAGREIRDFGWFKPEDMPVELISAQRDLIQQVLAQEFEKTRLPD